MRRATGGMPNKLNKKQEKRVAYRIGWWKMTYPVEVFVRPTLLLQALGDHLEMLALGGAP